MGAAERAPALELFEHYRLPDGFDAGALRRRAGRAVAAVLDRPGPHPRDLPQLGRVEVNLVDDRTVSQIHGDFSGVPGPTEVITFQHGEVFISLDTAAAQAGELGGCVEREAMLYLIHALLHLNGHQDARPDERAAMVEVQEAILDAVWPLR
ncbi:hypothetical protein BH23VER1_BH23VER1_12200 [soil metagenome]